MNNFAEQRKQAWETVRQLAADLPIISGTGYPVETPHALVIDRHFTISVTLYPEGDNGLNGIGKGRPHTNHHVEVVA